MTLWTAWQGKPLDEILYLCRELVEDAEFPTVHEWKKTGGKVLGHFQVYFPEEIAHAAGMLPVKVRGAQIEARRGDSHFGSYLCSILRSSLEVALTGRLPLDMFVTHPICDAARNLAGVWNRNFSYPAQILYLPQNANSASCLTPLSIQKKRFGSAKRKGPGASGGSGRGRLRRGVPEAIGRVPSSRPQNRPRLPPCRAATRGTQ